jgi:hypothetical protein
MSTTITHSAKDFAAALQKQLKQDMKDSLYASQQALNNTAFKARENLLNRFQGVFDIHNKNFFTRNIRKGVLVRKADRKKDGMDMSVDIVFPHDWFAIQAKGGVKIPGDQAKGRNHRMLAIPTSKGAVKLNASGRITGARASRSKKQSSASERSEERSDSRTQRVLFPPQKTTSISHLFAFPPKSRLFLY